jgi:hypothetical protein
MGRKREVRSGRADLLVEVRQTLAQRRCAVVSSREVFDLIDAAVFGMALWSATSAWEDGPLLGDVRAVIHTTHGVIRLQEKIVAEDPLEKWAGPLGGGSTHSRAGPRERHLMSPLDPEEALQRVDDAIGDRVTDERRNFDDELKWRGLAVLTFPWTERLRP